MSDNKTFRESYIDSLMADLDNIRILLEYHADSERSSLNQPTLSPTPPNELPTPLDRLVMALGLSHFERSLLLLALGVEIDPLFPFLCSRSLDSDSPENFATVVLACRLFGERSISTLDRTSPIYRWQLATIDPERPLLQAAIRITPWAAQYILGFEYTDPQFSGTLQPKKLNVDLAFIPDAYDKLSDTIIAIWSEFSQTERTTPLPPTQLIGKDSYAQQMVAALAYNQRGYIPYLIQAKALALNSEQISDWITQWQRQALLDKLALVIDCGDPTTLSPNTNQLISELLLANLTPIMLIGTERLPGAVNLITQDMPNLMPDDQKALWNYHLKELADPLQDRIGALVSQFNLNAEAIQSIATQARSQINAQGNDLDLPEITSILWKACRIQSRSSLEGLVERIEPKTTWQDLILPPDSTLILEQIIATIDQRAKVYDEWRMGGNTRRGMGITSLFYGPSGTGKTTAAEIIAHDLKLDLYRVDLSQVSSKYIGETEKNLEKVFDAAESSGAVLLFDEADSIIGKRSEVKDARDRYANQEVGYLLQRMEQYSGLAILTTNLPNSLDSAFMRRIRFSVRFEYPTPLQRAQIWQNCFPETTPTEGLSFPRLAQLDVSGASIRNIAMGSAFLAAKDQEPVQMKHILRAAQAELQKLGRSVTEQEVRGWL